MRTDSVLPPLDIKDAPPPKASASGRFDVRVPDAWQSFSPHAPLRPPHECDPDPLSKAMQGMRIDSFVTPVHTFGSPWGVLMPGVGSGAVHTVLSGSCVVRIEEGAWAGLSVHLSAGDILVLTRGLPHSMRDTADSPARPIYEAVPLGVESREGRMIRAGSAEGPETEVVFGAFTFAAGQVSVFWPALPGMLVHRAGGQGKAAGWADGLGALCKTLKSGVAYSSESICGVGWDQPGHSAIVNCWVQMVIVSAIQQHLSRSPSRELGWLRAGEDPCIAKSIRLIQQQPEQGWTVASLASSVGMSRTVFAERFAALVGQAPMRFLLRFRMDEACRLLLETTLGLKQIAARLGYNSQASFGVAFRREIGCSPGSFRQKHATNT